LLIAETAHDEPLPVTDVLAERRFGTARISIWRAGP